MIVHGLRRARLAFWLCTVGLLWMTSASVAGAEEEASTPSSRVKLDVALGTWISAGDTRWAHDASSAGFPLGNPTSKLIYQDHGTNVLDLTAKVSVGPKFFGRLNFGYAGIGGGRLTDKDFLTPDGGNASSTTHSDLRGNNMYYLNADAGVRVVTFANSRGWLDAFVGFQYWHQEFQAFGVRQVACTTAGSTIVIDPGPPPKPLCSPTAPTISSSVLAITNTTNWYSIRLGGQVEYQLTRRFGVQGSLVLLPISVLENEDIHHLRSDLRQNPSLSMSGIGFGADADVGLKFMVVRNLFLNLGYRLYWNRVIDGTFTTHPVTGGAQSFPLTEFQSIRHGLTAGINYTF